MELWKPKKETTNRRTGGTQFKKKQQTKHVYPMSWPRFKTGKLFFFLGGILTKRKHITLEKLSDLCRGKAFPWYLYHGLWSCGRLPYKARPPSISAQDKLYRSVRSAEETLGHLSTVRWTPEGRRQFSWVWTCMGIELLQVPLLLCMCLFF